MIRGLLIAATAAYLIARQPVLAVIVAVLLAVWAIHRHPARTDDQRHIDRLASPHTGPRRRA